MAERDAYVRQLVAERRNFRISPLYYGAKYLLFGRASTRLGASRNLATADFKHSAQLVSYTKRKRFGGRLPSNRPRKRRKRSSLSNWSFGPAAPKSFPTMARTRRSMSYSRFGRKRRRVTVSSNLSRRVKKLERNQEVKMFDLPVTVISNVGAAGDIRNLAVVVEGDGNSNRDGLRIAPFYLTLNYQWLGKILAIQEIYRTIILIDKRQVASTIPAVTDVLQQANALSQYNIANKGRFKILFDQSYGQASDATIANSVVGNIKRKLSMPMGFAAATGTSQTLNGLYLLNISNTTANLPDFGFSSRVFFND